MEIEVIVEYHLVVENGDHWFGSAWSANVKSKTDSKVENKNNLLSMIGHRWDQGLVLEWKKNFRLTLIVN